MKKLERLSQDAMGFLHQADKTLLAEGEITRVLRTGKPIPILVQNPCLDLRKVLDEMAEQDSVSIPKDANAYVASDFNSDTQHIRGDDTGIGKYFSVYAIQFYRVLW